MCRKAALPEIEHAKGERHTKRQSLRPEARTAQGADGRLGARRPTAGGPDPGRAFGARGEGREQRGEWGAGQQTFLTSPAEESLHRGLGSLRRTLHLQCRLRYARRPEVSSCHPGVWLRPGSPVVCMAAAVELEDLILACSTKVTKKAALTLHLILFLFFTDSRQCCVAGWPFCFQGLRKPLPICTI